MVYIPRSRDRICVDLHLHRASRYPEPAQLHLMTLITGHFSGSYFLHGLEGCLQERVVRLASTAFAISRMLFGGMGVGWHNRAFIGLGYRIQIVDDDLVSCFSFFFWSCRLRTWLDGLHKWERMDGPFT